MKKQIINLKIVFSIFFIFTIFSCATTPQPEPEIPQVEEIPEEEPEEETADQESEQEQEQIPEINIDDEVIYDEKDVEVVFEDEEITEDILEPIDDEEGFFISDKTILENDEENPEQEADLTEESENQKENETENLTDKDNSDTTLDEELSQKNPEISDNNTDNDTIELTKTDTSTTDTDDEISDNGFDTVIDITSDVFIDSEEEQEFIASESTEEEKEIIEPSRSVQCKVNQIIDIEYPGNGWVYIGEVEDKTMIDYMGRKINASKTNVNDNNFSLLARSSGKTIVKFYKADPLTGKFIYDYLEIIVKGKALSNNEHVKAPLYEEFIPAPSQSRLADAEKKQKIQDSRSSVNDTTDEDSNNTEANMEKQNDSSTLIAKNNFSQNKNSDKKTNSNSSSNSKNQKFSEPADESGAQTVIQQTESNDTKNSGIKKLSEDKEAEVKVPAEKQQIMDETKDLTSDAILELAQNSYNSGDYSKTLDLLNSFFDKATSRIDEGLFLQGQTFESKSKVRNIKKALDTYETIVKKYPQSINWAKANEKVTYLKKMYFNIR